MRYLQGVIPMHDSQIYLSNQLRLSILLITVYLQHCL